MSKLDEFEYFVEKSRKYSLLHMPNSEGSRKPVILLIDDLPTINGRAALVRLTKCLTALTHSTQVATIVLLTEYCKTESADSPTHHYEELESSLCRVGASKVTYFLNCVWFLFVSFKFFGSFNLCIYELQNSGHCLLG